ncbi:MAG TPA: hypothetical protein VEQ63_09780 [Bryobacteraceae bacterium]|nr:hypothetical protein [Bryobacteraceae bacterium]
MTRTLAWSSILYRNLLRMCPVELRDQFGSEMTLVFEDDLHDAWLKDGLWGVVSVWRCAVPELLHSGLSNACSTPSILVALISFVASACCLGGELALARIHAPASGNPTGLAEAVLAVIVWPSLTAAAVSFTAVRAGTQVAPLRLTPHDDRHSRGLERL